MGGWYVNIIYWIVFIVVGIWTIIIIPLKVENSIREYVSSINGELIEIDHVNLRRRKYIVKYKVNGTIITKKLRYSYRGDITWI